MSDRGTQLLGTRVSPGARATGFVSAVLLVVLLATSGWPGETQPLVDNTHVTSCEANAAVVGLAAITKDLRWSEAVAGVRVDLPRVPPRHRRVDSWGLPPPRAPCC